MTPGPAARLAGPCVIQGRRAVSTTLHFDHEIVAQGQNEIANAIVQWPRIGSMTPRSESDGDPVAESHDTVDLSAKNPFGSILHRAQDHGPVLAIPRAVFDCSPLRVGSENRLEHGEIATCDRIPGLPDELFGIHRQILAPIHRAEHEAVVIVSGLAVHHLSSASVVTGWHRCRIEAQ